MTKIINLTPHPVTLRRPDGSDLTVVPRSSEEGGPARVAQTPGTEIGCANGVPIYSSHVWGDVVGLPPPCDDTLYVVSSLVLSRVSGRDDVVAPGTGPNDGAVRNEKGHIVAVTRLVRG